MIPEYWTEARHTEALTKIREEIFRYVDILRNKDDVKCTYKGASKGENARNAVERKK